MRRHICLRLLLVLMVVATASGRATTPPSVEPPDWDSDIRLREAEDINPDPKIVEINLQAAVTEVDVAGEKVQAWTYNGGIPGPLIRANAGDRLIVHFTNQLPSPTTVHWHGIRLPIAMDGVPGISQDEVETGQSFTYDFTLPDAGLFWYHPHVESATQVGFGLSGPLLVEDPGEQIGVTDQLVLVLNDIEIDKGALVRPNMGGTAGMAFGREGNIVLVNGKKNASISARAGAPQRWRIVNTAKSRYFNINLRGTSTVLTKIGSDGGLLEYPKQFDTLVLAPGERADVIVAPKGKPGTTIQVVSELYNRGFGSVEFREAEDLFRIALNNQPVLAATPLPKIRRTIEPLSAEGATPVKFELTITQDSPDGKYEYRVNGKPFWKAKPILGKIGETQIWTVNNTTAWSHPIHLHGFFFLVLDKAGQPVRPLEWKDTVNVPFNQSLQFLVRYDDREGEWMVHCHILDHAEGGLMTTVKIGNGPDKGHMHHP